MKEALYYSRNTVVESLKKKKKKTVVNIVRRIFGIVKLFVEKMKYERKMENSEGGKKTSKDQESKRKKRGGSKKKSGRNTEGKNTRK